MAPPHEIARKRKSYSVREKLEVVSRVQKGESQAKVSRDNGVPESSRCRPSSNPPHAWFYSNGHKTISGLTKTEETNRFFLKINVCDKCDMFE